MSRQRDNMRLRRHFIRTLARVWRLMLSGVSRADAIAEETKWTDTF